MMLGFGSNKNAMMVVGFAALVVVACSKPENPQGERVPAQASSPVVAQAETPETPIVEDSRDSSVTLKQGARKIEVTQKNAVIGGAKPEKKTESSSNDEWTSVTVVTTPEPREPVQPEKPQVQVAPPPAVPAQAPVAPIQNPPALKSPAPAPVARTQVPPALAPNPPVVQNPIAEALQPVPATPLAKSPDIATNAKQKIGLQLFAALGMNYVRYTESLSDVDTNYVDFRGPSVHVGIGMDLTDETSVEATYKSTPFRFDNSSVSGSNLSGNWETVSVQGVSKRRSFTNRGTEGGEAAWLYGFQIHQVPYALFENATNAAVVRPIQLIDLSLGGRWRKMLNPWTRSVIFMRGQFPISTSSSSNGSHFSAKSKLLFDGSIGAEKRVSDALWVGLHWYGQYHNLDFKYDDPLITAEGNHSTLFSNIEVRMNWDF